jgi:hypothetical protein
MKTGPPGLLHGVSLAVAFTLIFPGFEVGTERPVLAFGVNQGSYRRIIVKTVQ